MLLSPVHSRMTLTVPQYDISLIRSVYDLILAFFPVERLFGTSRPNIYMVSSVHCAVSSVAGSQGAASPLTPHVTNMGVELSLLMLQWRGS